MLKFIISNNLATKYKNMLRFLVLVCLVIFAESITLHRSHYFTHMTNVQKPHFTLTLEYNALDSFPIDTAVAEIYWNAEKIGTLKPKSKRSEAFSGKVKVVEGKNKLTIKGTKDSTGLIIDNVNLVRDGTTDNIVQNGDFEKKWPQGQKSSNTFPGWVGEPIKAIANQLKKVWSANTVVIIDSTLRSTLIQNFNFDREYHLLTPKYFLTFQYTAQAKSALNSSYGKVTWNDQVFQIKPQNFAVNEFKHEVTVKSGPNSLKIQGEGEADGQGLTIDNVKLTGLGSLANILMNGNFQLPHIKGETENLEILPGWQSNNKKITIGLGSYFNQKWSKKTGQVLTLDNNQNIAITQVLNFGPELNYLAKEKPYFTVSFSYAPLEGAIIQNSKGQLLLDGEVIAEFAPQSGNIHTFNEQVTLRPGNNEFSIRPKAGSTIVIGDFKIVREGLFENVAANGNFSQPSYDGFVAGWKGSAQVLESLKTNKNWKNAKAKVAKLASKDKDSLSQIIQLNPDFKIKTNKFILEFEYVPTAQAKLDVPLGQVSWNGQVFKIIAHHRRLHVFKVVVIASRGQNLLTFEGKGKNGQGITIDNVKFTPYGSKNQLVSNGDFQDPEIKGSDNFKSFYTITQWDGHNIELGQGERYSKHWPEKNGQVLSLASSHKTVVYKILSFSEHLSIFDGESKNFKLSFKYAAEQGKPLAKSGGEIFWNKVLIGDIVPTNYKINTYTINFKAKTGKNDLFIKGAGGIQAYGLTIDDVELFREGSKDNLIENGQFNQPATPGWNSIVGHAPLLNHNWEKIHVGKIDAVENLTLSKTFEFDSRMVYKTNKFVLKFDYALHKNLQVDKAEATCQWNNQKFKIKPTDKKVHRFETIVFASQGENSLSFEGEGITIDDVRLVPWGSAVSVLLNGGFEDPQFSAASLKDLPSGWKCEQVEYTKGYEASTEWNYFSNQVITLTTRNKHVSQIVTFGKDKRVIRSQFSFHELYLEYSAVDGNLQDSKGEVYWNGRLMGTLKPKKEGVNKFTVKIDATSGVNTLTFKALQEGIAVGNFELVRYNLAESIIENSQFDAKVVDDDKIPGWEGSAVIGKSEDYCKAWQGSKVAVLKPGKRNSISQEFRFDGNLRLITSKFVLDFQYTVRQGVKFQTAKAKVIWNEQIFNLSPKDYDLHLFHEVVQARKGNNYIIFQSDGIKRKSEIFAQGFTLDDVWVRAYGSSKNILVNGGFEQPKIQGFDYGMFTSVVPGWTTKDIYLGVGYYFSKNWVDTQIIELDGNHQNAKIMQEVKIGKNWEIIQ